MITGRLTRRFASAAVGTALAVTGLAVAPQAAHAADTDVAINEIFYHAYDVVPDAWSGLEFIELVNGGADAVDVSGWSFSAGITLLAPLAAGTEIAPGGFLVGTNDPALFESKYGFPADFAYTGTSLSNSGETVTLVDDPATVGDPPTVVDTLTYDDAAPWPVQPDGSGGSLELDGPQLDNALATNWHASTAMYGTPRAVNTIAPLAIGTPTRTPTAPDPGQPVQVDATAPVGSTLTLTYKVMYAPDVDVPMLDDAGSAGGAGDGTYSAQVPGAAAGELVRFRIAGSKGLFTGSYPIPGDSRPYDGWVVKDPALSTAQLPVLQWFMPDDVYNDMNTNHRCDGVDANATFAWNGMVLDGGLMHIKGHTTCTDLKAKWDVELPSGYTFDFGAPFPHPMKGFDLQNEAIPVPRLGWEMIGQAAPATAAYQTMRVQRNGKFFAVFGVLENYDSKWRAANGYSDAPFYKVEAGGLRTYSSVDALAASGDIAKKNPDDGNYSDIWQLTQVLAMPNGPAKRAWLMEHLDIPQLTDYTALVVVMRQWDSGSKNFFLARSPQSGRWQAFAWDLDGILSGGSDPKGDFVTLSTTNKLWAFLMSDPQTLAMHYRRVRTLADQFLSGTTLLDRFDALTVPYANDLALDYSVWGGRRLSGVRTKVIDGIQERRNMIAKHTGATQIPVSQSANPQLVINEIHYQPTVDAAEYLEIHNPSTTESVDLSSWSVSGLGGFTARQGTVLPAGDYLVWVKDDANFVSTFGGNHLMAQVYPGSLDNAGEELTLLNASGGVVDTVSYSPQPPWPTAAAGTGPSLELVDPASDNADPASWAASQQTGTPAARNSVTAGPPVPSTVLPLGATGWRYLATGPDQGTSWRATSFNDSGWATGRASLGFRNPVTTTIPATTGRITYYFRTTFAVPTGQPIQGATLRLVADDAAIVYVNGVEVVRHNLPTGTVGFTTKALTAVSGAAETTPVDFTIPASALTEGTNTIAVEVHQASAGSVADLTMDSSVVILR